MSKSEKPPSRVRRVDIKLGGIYEVIVTTFNLSGEPHAAPMGVTFLDRHLFAMRSYGETTTLRNLKSNKRGALNIIDDVETFFYSIFKPYKLTFKWFRGIPVLTKASTWSLFELKEVLDKGQYYEVHCLITDWKVSKTKPKPICRAEASLLEALIHYTRLKHYVSVGDESKAEELEKLIDHQLSIVERTGWSKLKRMAKDLKKRTSLVLSGEV